MERYRQGKVRRGRELERKKKTKPCGRKGGETDRPIQMDRQTRRRLERMCYNHRETEQ